MLRWVGPTPRYDSWGKRAGQDAAAQSAACQFILGLLVCADCFHWLPWACGASLPFFSVQALHVKCTLAILVVVIFIAFQDSNSSRLLPGSSYSCCIRNLRAHVHMCTNSATP
jgi:hypothetical protein